MGSYRPHKDLLAGRTILVTGASDGIGRVAAITYAHHGADVLLLGRNRKKLEAVNDEITTTTATSPLIIPFDLTKLHAQSETDLTGSLRDAIDRLDGILHNASLLGPKVPVAHYPSNDWETVMHVNVTAAFLLTKALLPTLERSSDASVIFTSSGVGRRGRAYWGAYAVSKFATEGMMEVLADEVSDTNIRVNSLNPGGTRTTMRAAAYPAEDPMTLPTPQEHMPLYLYLIGPDSEGINGQKFDASSWSGPTPNA